MYIDGDSIIQPDFSLIEISLEHCSEYAETNIECAREREIQNFWKEFFKYNVSYLTISAKQIDLQEIDDPIKNKYQYDEVILSNHSYQKFREIVFDVNEFYDSNDPVGFLPSEPDTFTFLSKTSSKTVVQSDDTGLPRIEWTMRLGDNKKEISRQVYTIFTLIGDVGGFNSAIILIAAPLMSFYSNHIYKQSIQAEIPVK